MTVRDADSPWVEEFRPLSVSGPVTIDSPSDLYLTLSVHPNDVSMGIWYGHTRFRRISL